MEEAEQASLAGALDIEFNADALDFNMDEVKEKMQVLDVAHG